MLKHYHVLAGIHGCMPDYNAFYETKQEAKDGLLFWVRSLRDTGLKFSGNLKAGYFECINQNYYTELSRCDEITCKDNQND